MAYTLRGKVRVELEVQGGRLIVQAFVDDQPLDPSDALFAGLAAVLGGQRPVMAQLVALTAAQVFVEEQPQLPFAAAGLVRLVEEAAIEVIPSARTLGSHSVRPDASLPISLFVPPERQGPLQRLVTELHAGWERMLSAAQSRGQSVDPQVAERILSALCEERLASDSLLSDVLQRTGSQPLRLSPRGLLQSDEIAFPIESLRILGDRCPTVRNRLQNPPLRIRCSAPVAEYGQLFGRLCAGITGAELRLELQHAPRAIAQLVLDLQRAGLLGAAPPLPPLDVPPGTVTHLGHATLLANLGGRYVLVDPFLPPASQLDTLRPPALAELPPLSAILITHHHWDHVHLETLFKLSKRVPVYLPRQVQDRALVPRTERLLAYLGFTQVHTLGHGESFAVGDGGRVQAVPFFGEDPMRIDYVGNCYALIHNDCAALVHVDSGTDWQGQSAVTSGAARRLAEQFAVVSPVFATRRQELGTLVEHTWEFLLRPANEWVRPTENCNNSAAFLAALCEQAKTPWLVVYSEGGAAFYPDGTNFLRRPQEPARVAPYEYLWEPWDQIVATVERSGAQTHLSAPFQRFQIGGGPIAGLARVERGEASALGRRRQDAD